MKKTDYTYAVGRRKTAIARVRLYKSASVPGHDGAQLMINGKNAEVYFGGNAEKNQYRLPFIVTETLTKMSASAKAVGGGVASQLDAIVHGVARALIKYDPNLRATLKSAGLLTRDPRAKERRKIGTGGKARRAKQSPKR
jgi:small subunit ribosomal protein S9